MGLVDRISWHADLLAQEKIFPEIVLEQAVKGNNKVCLMVLRKNEHGNFLISPNFRPGQVNKEGPFEGNHLGSVSLLRKLQLQSKFAIAIHV